jgi:hypothetical protein
VPLAANVRRNESASPPSQGRTTPSEAQLRASIAECRPADWLTASTIDGATGLSGEYCFCALAGNAHACAMSDRFRGGADIEGQAKQVGSVAIDPLRKSGGPKRCDAQHGFSTMW